jgi:hypothetical protein
MGESGTFTHWSRRVKGTDEQSHETTELTREPAQGHRSFCLPPVLILL